MKSQKGHKRTAERRTILYWAMISFILIIATALGMLVMEVVRVDDHPWKEQRVVPSSSRANLVGVEARRLCRPEHLGRRDG